MLVLLFHFGLPDALRAGFIGVDIFFVISGYLIVPPIVRGLKERTFSFQRFYERRIRRLAPALLATTTLTLVAALAILTPIELVSFAKETLAAQLYVSNIYYWRYLNYFGLLANQSFQLHTWSLGVEEQFYLVFPVGLWLAAKVLPRRLITIVAVVGAASFALNLLTVGWKPEATFYLLPTRAWEFAAGAMVPELIAFARRQRFPSLALVVPGAIILIIALAIYERTFEFPGWYATLPVTATVLLLAGGADQTSAYSRVMGSAVPRYIGRISYELYLVHWPVRIFLPLLVLDVTAPVRVVAMALCFIIAAAIYHLAEAPIRGRRILRTAVTLIPAYGIATLATVAALAAVVISEGLPARFNQQTLNFAAAGNDIDTQFRACEGKALSPCRIGAAQERPTWLIYGDSHADALGAAFNALLVKRREGAYFAFLSACLPVMDAGGSDCRTFNRDIERFLKAHPGVRKIALVSTWQLGDGFVGDGGRFVQGAAATASFDRSLERTIAALGDRQLIIWLPVPGARTTAPPTLARNAMWGRDWELRIPRTEYDRNTQFLRNHLNRHPEIAAIDPGSHLCARGWCEVTSGGRPLYYDNAHPAASQHAVFERFIEADLRKLSKTNGR